MPCAFYVLLKDGWALPFFAIACGGARAMARDRVHSKSACRRNITKLENLESFVVNSLGSVVSMAR